MDAKHIKITLDNQSFNISSQTQDENELHTIESQVNTMLEQESEHNPEFSLLRVALFCLFKQTAETNSRIKQYKNLEAVVTELKENRRREDDARNASRVTSEASRAATPAKRPFQTVTSEHRDN